MTTHNVFILLSKLILLEFIVYLINIFCQITSAYVNFKWFVECRDLRENEWLQ